MERKIESSMLSDDKAKSPSRPFHSPGSFVKEDYVCISTFRQKTALSLPNGKPLIDNLLWVPQKRQLKNDREVLASPRRKDVITLGETSWRAIKAGQAQERLEIVETTGGGVQAMILQRREPKVEDGRTNVKALEGKIERVEEDIKEGRKGGDGDSGWVLVGKEVEDGREDDVL